MLHAIKIHPQHFAALVAGRLTADILIDDRPYSVGDDLVRQEWDPETKRYTGREHRSVITHIHRDFKGLGKNFCILSHRTIPELAIMPAARPAEDTKHAVPHSAPQPSVVAPQTAELLDPSATNEATSAPAPMPEESGLVQALPE